MNNVGPSHTIFEDQHDAYQMLEKLPPKIREIITHAPYEYALKPWFRDFLRLSTAYSVDQVAQIMMRDMARDRGLEALELYGPTHPQALKAIC